MTSAVFRVVLDTNEIFLLCALDGDADYLVSDDKHLLALRPHYTRPTIGNCAHVAAGIG